MFTVYAISSEMKNYIYVGMTSNIEQRIHAHNSGYEKTTKPYRPFILLFTKEYSSRTEARTWEKYYKSTTGKTELRKIKEQKNS